MNKSKQNRLDQITSRPLIPGEKLPKRQTLSNIRYGLGSFIEWVAAKDGSKLFARVRFGSGAPKNIFVRDVHFSQLVAVLGNV